VAHQSLYRRYRPRRFAEVRGQEHVVKALRNAVGEGRFGHAYLFSGPRGTGKTSAARILAKALNCEAPVDGEPCLKCASCVAIEAGTSFDLHELDAASNNGVEAMRDLISKAALGTPGRTKVYILDEAHMLSPAASNALLKTLEEPPGHVVFVLATTEPHKVLPTIRSRTQHFDFHLLPADEVEGLVRDIAADAGIDIADDVVDSVVRAGGGSARDSLSALDQVAAGGTVERSDEVDELVEAIAEQDTARALVAVTDATAAGRDARVIGERLLGRLRDVFLAAMKAGLDHLADADRTAVTAFAERFEARRVTRALEVLGQALVDMHQAPDSRICLEVALVRLTNPDTDPSPAALADRLDRLERAVAKLAAPGAAAAASTAAARPQPSPPPTGTRSALGAHPVGAAASPAAPAPAAAPPPSPPAAAPPVPAVGGPLPSRDQLTLAWGDHVLARLVGPAKARFSGGHFVAVEAGVALFALPNAVHRDRAEEYRPTVEAALQEHFNRPVLLKLVIEGATPAPEPDASPPEVVDVAELEDAPDGHRSNLELLTEAFPGSEMVDGG
jgi:DNA polymerase-3 subunit gamma/tau